MSKIYDYNIYGKSKRWNHYKVKETCVTMNEILENKKSELVIYESNDGNIKLNVNLEKGKTSKNTKILFNKNNK